MQTLKITVMAFLSRDDKEGIIKYCCRYPYVAREHQKLLGILYIFSIFLSFMYFITFEIFGSSNMFKLSLPEVTMNPYLQNRTELYGAAMKEMPIPTYCARGTPASLSERIYPEGLEITRSLNTASSCDDAEAASATLGEILEDGSFFVRTMRVVYDINTKAYTARYSLYPEKMTFGFKHVEVSKAWPKGVSTCKATSPANFENGKLEWDALSKLFDDSSVKSNLLDLKNADAFAGLVNDGTEATLPTYRQTGAVFVLVVNYFNYPRDLSELGYLLTSSSLRASVEVKHAPGLIGRKSPQQVINPSTGAATHIIYEYGVKLKFVMKGSVGTLSFSNFLSCMIRSFSLLFAAGATLTFISRPWIKYDMRTGENIAIVKDTPGKGKNARGKQSKKGSRSTTTKSIQLGFTSKASDGKGAFDDTAYQIPYVRNLYDDSGHDIERALRNRTRKAFGLMQDLQLDSQALAPAIIPTSRNSAINFDLGRTSTNRPSAISESNSRNSFAQSVSNIDDLGLDENNVQRLRRALEKIDRLEGTLNELKTSHNDVQRKINMSVGQKRLNAAATPKDI